MYILILLYSLKSQFHHQVDLYTISGLKIEFQCQALGKKLSEEFKQLSADIDMRIICEENK